MSQENACKNTDVKLWEDQSQPEGYRDYVYVTEGGGIGISSGGKCVVRIPKRWVELGWDDVPQRKK